MFYACLQCLGLLTLLTLVGLSAGGLVIVLATGCRPGGPPPSR